MPARIKDSDPGFAKLAEALGEMGSITIGVQGKQAEQPHPEKPSVTVGQVAAWHEMGVVPGAPARHWLSGWLDKNKQRMVADARRQLQNVLQGHATRNQALIKMGYEWTDSVRRQFVEGKIKPANAATTIKKKGDNRPMLDTAAVANAVTYRVFLPNKKSVKDRDQRRVLFGKK